MSAAAADLAAAPAPVARLGYAFAKTQGVVLAEEGGRPVCRHRPDATIEALVEAQRVQGGLVAFGEVAPAAFEEALGRAYRDSSSEAAKVAADASGDLALLADTAASVDTLLDRNDDAPVVRLIDALLLEAVKEAPRMSTSRPRSAGWWSASAWTGACAR